MKHFVCHKYFMIRRLNLHNLQKCLKYFMIYRLDLHHLQTKKKLKTQLRIETDTSQYHTTKNLQYQYYT